VGGAKVGRLEADGADTIGADADAETETGANLIGIGRNFARDDEIVSTTKNPFVSIFELQRRIRFNRMKRSGIARECTSNVS
jgi:hypothetical protein